MAERNHVGSITDVPADAKTIEEAMGIGDLVEQAVGEIAVGRQSKRATA